MSNIIISGGGIVNKGAQAMTLICVCELRERYPEHRIFLLNWSAGKNEQKKFENYRLDLLEIPPLKFSGAANSPVKKLLYSVRYRESFTKTDEIFRHTDMFIDISGYALGSNWSAKVSNDYLDNIEHALAYNIPVYLFPQSFGPFDWVDEDGARIDRRIRSLFPRIKLICAREEEGYRALVDTYGLCSNIVLCKDMVLTSRISDYSPALKIKKETELPEISSNSICLIPNVRVTDPDGCSVREVYRIAIRNALEKGFCVYLMFHSSQDRELCLELKGMYNEDDRVIFIDRDHSCIEFNELVKKFRFVIASRFHALVHALKNGVPCIALGWATKYMDLMKLFGQEQYAFDLRERVEISDVENAVAEMSQMWQSESEIIRRTLPDLQRENVFDYIKRI